RARTLYFFGAFVVPNFSSKIRCRDHGETLFQQDQVSGSWGDYVLRASISFVVIGFALAGSISSAAAQYLPPQPPPAGYPPPAHDPDPASPPPPYQRGQPSPDTAREPYDDADAGPYPAQPLPTIGDTKRQPPDGIISEPLAPPATSPQDRGTAVA